MKSKEAKEFLKEILQLDLQTKDELEPDHYTPTLWGGSGIGKTDICKQAAKELGYDEVIVIELNTLSPLDLRGMPYVDAVNEICKFFPPEFLRKDEFDKEGNIINPKKYLYFFDEFNNAPPLTQSVLYRIALERTMGSHPLPKYTTIVLAGNRGKDKGATFNMPEPLANRCVHIEFEPSARDFLDYHKESIEPRIAAFLEFKPTHVHKDLIEGYKVNSIPSFPSYRTWKKLSNYLLSKPNEPLNIIKISSFIGFEVGSTFNEFASIQNKLPNLDDLLFERGEEQFTQELQIQYFIIVSLFLRLEHYMKTKEYYDKTSNQIIKLSDASLKKLFVNYVKYVLRFSEENELKVLGATYIMRSENKLTHYYSWLGEDHPIFLEIERIMKTSK